MLQPIDQHRDIDLLGLDVVRLDRRFVGRRCQEPSGFGLEVIGLGDVGDTRPIARPATPSAQAPAALMTTGAAKLPAGVSARQDPRALSRDRTSAPATISAPLFRAPRR